MALSRHVRHTAICTSALLGLAVTGARAVEETDSPPPYVYQELRFGIVGAPAPSVRAGGHNVPGGDSRGYRFGVTYLSGSAPFNDYCGTVWGAQASVGSYNIGSPSQDLSQGMVDVYYGLQYGIVESEALRGFGEILPYLGGGFSDTNVIKDGENQAGLGGALEGGVRAGAYLTERHWLAGLTVAYVYGLSKISADEDIDLRTNGFQFGGELGYRF